MVAFFEKENLSFTRRNFQFAKFYEQQIPFYKDAKTEIYSKAKRRRKVSVEDDNSRG